MAGSLGQKKTNPQTPMFLTIRLHSHLALEGVSQAMGLK